MMKMKAVYLIDMLSFKTFILIIIYYFLQKSIKNKIF